MTKKTTDIDDIWLEETESYIIIEIPVTHTLHLPDGQFAGIQSPPNDAKLINETRLQLQFKPQKSLVNLDYWFDPGFSVDWPDTVEYGDHTFTLVGSNADLHMMLYDRELRAAARQRAAEDRTHAVNVLASWLHQSEGKDHLDDGLPRTIFRSLKAELDAADEPIDWAVCYEGRPDRWRHEQPPAQTIDEAYAYSKGGYEAVERHRERNDD